MPVYLTEEQLADPEAAIESSAFEPVLAVLRALRAHDPELVTDATRIATSLGRRDAVVGGYISEHIQVLGAELDVSGFERALELRFVEVSKDAFDVGLTHLLEFVEETGHARPLLRHRAVDGYRLGGWVNECRVAHNRGVLGQARSEALERLPGWTWHPHEDAWQDGIQHLREYAAERGDAGPLQRHVAADGYRLGAWVGQQRYSYSNGQLTPERASDLESLPGWTWEQQADDWLDALAHLRHYADAHGHARPPAHYVSDDGFRLGAWVIGRRSRRAKLTEAQAGDLEALPGWTWDSRESRWMAALAYLRDYADAHGHACPPVAYVSDDGFRLGAWVSRTRSKRGKLLPSRIADLEELPGWTWDLTEARWVEAMSELSAFAESHAHVRPSKDYVSESGFGLGTWVDGCRQRYRRGQLAADQVAELEAINGWTWDPRESDWQEGLYHLRAYAEQTGHSQPPSKFVSDDGFRLGGWVNVRRTAYGRGKLSQERISQLEALPGWTWKVQ